MDLKADATLTIAYLSSLLRDGTVSPVELACAILERIERMQPQLNSFIALTADIALRQARRAEGEIRRGKYRGALHGIPIALKDLFHQKGVRTTAGSRILADSVAAENAAVVERLIAAGAVLVGKTNLHEFAYGPTNLNPHYGHARNPWDLSRITGGSSGGSAAAVVTGQAVAALGTDTGRSFRIPAAACGCVGLKPSYGRVPLRGVIPLSSTLDHAGPLTRSVEDAALVLEAIAGADPGDPFSWGRTGESFTGGLRRGLRGIRIGLPRQYFFDHLQGAVRGTVLAAIAVMEGNGAQVREVDLPFLEDTERVSVEIIGAEALIYHWKWLQQRPEDYGLDVRLRLESYPAKSAADYLRALKMKQAYAQAFRKTLQSVHILAAPTLPLIAPRIEQSEIRLGRRMWNTRAALLRCTRPGNLSGLPALSLPCGFSPEGLPVGLQLIGRPGDEGTLLRAAHAYEQLTPWHSRFPAG